MAKSRRNYRRNKASKSQRMAWILKEQKIEEALMATEKCVVCHEYRDEGTSFHRFPRDRVRLKAWLDACNMKKLPSVFSKLCSRHFSDNCFYASKSEDEPSSSHVSRVLLNKDAIPCVNLPEKVIKPKRQSKSKKIIPTNTKTNNSIQLPIITSVVSLSHQSTGENGFQTMMPETEENMSSNSLPVIKIEPTEGKDDEVWLESLLNEPTMPTSLQSRLNENITLDCLSTPPKRKRDFGTEVLSTPKRARKSINMLMKSTFDSTIQEKNHLIDTLNKKVYSLELKINSMQEVMDGWLADKNK